MSESLSLGPIIYTAVKPIFKIYFIIGCGFWLGKKNILTVDTARNLSDIVVSMVLPCLMFQKIVTNLQSSDIKQIGIIVLFSVFLLVVGGLGAIGCYLFSKPKYWFGGCLCVGLMPNISDLPIAYLQTFASGLVFSSEDGEKGAAYICIYTAFQVFCLFNLGMVRFIGWDFDSQTKQEERDIELRQVRSTTNHSTAHNKDDDDSHEDAPNIYHQTTSDDDADIDHEANEHDVIPLTRLTSELSGISRTQSRLSNVSVRRQRSQTIQDVITEYSQAESLKDPNLTAVQGDFTEVEVKEKPQPTQSKAKTFLLFALENMKKPLSMTLLVAIVVAMIPWVKALFVTSDQVTINAAPDDLPPLSFIMDYVSYLANACIPLGLLILGSTLSRLSIGEMPKGFWITPFCLSIFRLVIQPIIGVCVTLGFSRLGWFDGDDMLKFVSTIVWGLPNATSLIYITAFYTPVENYENYDQMNYLALTYIFEYPILAISLPFLTTFTIKVLLDY